MSLLSPESAALRSALLTGYLLTFGLGFNGMSPVYAAAVSDRFSGKKLGTILGLFPPLPSFLVMSGHCCGIPASLMTRAQRATSSRTN